MTRLEIAVEAMKALAPTYRVQGSHGGIEYIDTPRLVNESFFIAEEMLAREATYPQKKDVPS